MPVTGREKVTDKPQWAIWFFRLAPWLVGLQVAISTCVVLLSGNPWIAYPTDDYFYYLKIAQNLAGGHGSTFNGIVPTNGYHPLWLLILTAFNFFTKSGTANLALIGIVALAATVACFVWGRAIFRLAGISDDLISTSLALWTAAYCCRQFYLGMEVVLAVPLAFLLILLVFKGQILESAKSAFALGMVCSLLMLARLDTGFLVALLGIGVLSNHNFRQQITPAKILALLAGLLPFFFYLGVNKIEFGTLLPVSGLAKQLTPHDHFHPEAWQSVLVQGNYKEHFHIAFILLSTIVILLSYRKLSPAQRVVFPFVVLFPVVYYTVLSFLSDWRSLSAWYIYAVRPSLCIALAFWFSRNFIKKFMSKPLFRYSLLALGVFALATNVWRYPNDRLYEEATAIHKFALDHPGIYAMGDRAGKTSFLLPDPMVQLEGLVMDRDYLEHLQRQDDLRTVLKGYHVRYYIADVQTGYTGCFQAIEPWEAGPLSKRMRGTFCETPVWQLPSPGGRLVIFDLDQVSGSLH